MDREVAFLIFLFFIRCHTSATEAITFGAPTNVTATSNSTSLQISWQAVDSAAYDIIGYRVQYRDSNSNITDSYAAFLCSNITTLLITNLKVYTDYEVDVRAFTQHNISSSGTNATLRTGEGAPTSPPVNIQAVNSSSTSLNVSWDQVPEEHRHGVISRYILNITEVRTGDKKMVEQCNGSLLYATVDNLKKYTWYRITVSALTSKGQSNYSQPFRIRTAEDAPDEPPTAIRGFSINSSSISVSWGPVSKRGSNGIIREYKVYWKVTASPLNYTSETVWLVHSHSRRRRDAGVPDNVTEVEIFDLETFTNYTIQVSAITVKEGNKSSPIYILSGEGVPQSPPIDVIAFNTSATTINVTWHPPNASTLQGYLQGYEVTYMPADKPSLERSSIVCSKETRVHLFGLVKYTLHNITVAAFTKVGPGNESNVTQAWTDEDKPDGPPKGVRAEPDTFSSIRVSWQPVNKSLQNGIITKYRVEVNDSGGLVTNQTVGAQNLTTVIQNLNMSVNYSVRVQAFTRKGGGPFSPVSRTTTNNTAPNAVPSNVSATAISSTSIHVTWEIHKPHPLVQLREFRVYYRQEEQTKWKNVTLRIPPTIQKTNLTGLLMYTRYEIRVAATTTQEGNQSSPDHETTKEGVPSGPPSGVQAEAESAVSIRVSWHPVPQNQKNGNITKYYVEVFNISQVLVANKTVSGLYAVVPGLQVFSNYSAKVQAFTKIGAGNFSQFVHTRTHETAPDVVPVNVTVESVTRTSIYVTWDPVLLLHPFVLRGYQIMYYGISPRANLQNKTINETTAGINLTGLSMFTQYGIRVAARTTQAGNFSAEAVAKTKEGVPSAPPSYIVPEILGSTVARITWGPVPAEHHNGIIRGYRVIYRSTGNGSDSGVSVTTDAETQVVLLNSLAKAAEYEIRVLAFTSQGNGVSRNLTFNTGEDVPSQPPRNLTVENKISPHRIRLSWEPVPKQFMHGKLVHYHVTYQVVEIGGVRQEDKPVESMFQENATFLNLTNLEPYAKYSITVAARTARGLGPASAAVLGETCHCVKRLTTSWRPFVPYVNVIEDGDPGPIIPFLLQAMVDDCCGDCQEHNRTMVDFKMNGNGKPSLVNSSRELLEHLDENTDFAFPVHGYNEQESYKGGFGYAPVVESGGVAFIVYPEVSSTRQTMFNSLILCLPVLLLPIVMAYIAGVLVWMLERKPNSRDFPPSFLLGTWEGIWWSFVSMTTLGYGDRAPLGWKGRIFAVVWILYGLVIIAITMAMLTTALTTISLESEPKLYGSKVAAEVNSPEYTLGIRRNAFMDPGKEYHSLEQVAEALINREVEGALVDAYSGGLRGDLFNKPSIRVSKVIDYKTAYGIVLSPSSTRLRKCFALHMHSHRAEVFGMIESQVQTLKTPSEDEEPVSESVSYGLYDARSPTFQKALKYACVCLGILLLFCLVYEVVRQARRRHKVHQQVQRKVELLCEMRNLLNAFHQRMHEKVSKLKAKHRKELINLVKLKRDAPYSTKKDVLWVTRGSKTTEDLAIDDL